MGSAYSSNVVDLTVNAMAKVMNDYTATTSGTADNTVTISIGDGSTFSGNTIDQEATTKITFKADFFAKSEVQQALVEEIEQKAKSLVSGINLMQFTNANNTLRNTINATIDISDKVATDCKATADNNIVIRVGKNATVTGNVLRQQARALVDCITKSVSESTEMQDLQVKISQAASATSKGFDLWEIIIILVVVGVILVGGVGVTFASSGKMVVKIIAGLFPLLCLGGGAACVGVWAGQKESQMSGYGYTKLLTGTSEEAVNCRDGAVQIEEEWTKKNFESAGMAAEACEKQKECKAMVYQKADVGDDGKATLLTDGPRVTFYDGYSRDNCMAIDRQGKSRDATTDFNTAGATNYTAFKIHTREEWLLPLGIALLGVGGITGTVQLAKAFRRKPAAAKRE